MYTNHPNVFKIARELRGEQSRVEQEVRALRQGQQTRPPPRRAIRRENARPDRIKASFDRGDTAKKKNRCDYGILTYPIFMGRPYDFFWASSKQNKKRKRETQVQSGKPHPGMPIRGHNSNALNVHVWLRKWRHLPFRWSHALIFPIIRGRRLISTFKPSYTYKTRQSPVLVN